MTICGALGKDQVSQFLKVFITDLTSGDMVVGYISEGAAATLSSDWTAPFQGMNLASIAGQQTKNSADIVSRATSGSSSKLGRGINALSKVVGGVADKAVENSELIQNTASLFGFASASTINSAMVWQGQQPPQFNIGIHFIAHSDPYNEVHLPIKVLQQMASPQLNAVTPGGRVPSRVTLDIGRRIKLTDVIIQTVTYPLDAPRNSDGFFIQSQVSLECCGQTSYNRDEFDGIFI